MQQPVYGLIAAATLIFSAAAQAQLPQKVGDTPVPSLAPIIKKASPAVVNIATKGTIKDNSRNPLLDDPFFRRFFDAPDGGAPRERQFQSAGSGVIVDAKNGYIITNAHVLENANEITVTFQDDRTSKAEVVGKDTGSDVAVLKVEKSNLPAVQFADSDKASVGDPVIAFGSPLGLNGTVTTGIISAMERPVKTGGREGGEEAYMAAIQTDAAINPGNSGGPLVDGDGRVLGIDSAIATIPGETGKIGSIGLGFAIPMNQAKRTAEQLIANGKATTTVIGDAVDLIALVRKLPPGTKASLVYTRGGRPATTSITLGAKTVN